MGKYIFAGKLLPQELKKEELEANPLLNLLKDTPNFKPFAMRLAQIGVEHTPCGGDVNGKYILDSESAHRSLPSLIMKPIHIVNEFNAHRDENGKFKTIGVTLGGRITVNADGKFIDAVGALWGEDYPNEVKFIQLDNEYCDKLGASYEIWGEDHVVGDNIYMIKNYYFGGSAILFKEDAAMGATKILFASDDFANIGDTNSDFTNIHKDEWGLCDSKDKEDEIVTENVGEVLSGKKLTVDERNALPDDDFALIQKRKNKNTGKIEKIRRFPIHDISHARNALARLAIAKDISDAEKKRIRRKILNKFPEIESGKKAQASDIVKDGNDNISVKNAKDNKNGSVMKESGEKAKKKKIVKIIKGGVFMEFCEECKAIYEKALEDGVIIPKESIEQNHVLASKDGEIENLKAENEKLQIVTEELEKKMKIKEEEDKVKQAHFDAAKKWDEKYFELYDEEEKDKVIEIQAKILLNTATYEDIDKLVSSKKTQSSLVVSAGSADDKTKEEEKKKQETDYWAQKAHIVNAMKSVH